MAPYFSSLVVVAGANAPRALLRIFMKLIHNNSFVYSDINRASNHKARYKKQNKRKFVTSDARNICRFGLLFG